MMLKVGITGGIGSGKTTVCKILELWGIPVFYSDARAKDLMQTDLKLIEDIKASFGESVYFENGQPDRKRLASIVFNDEHKLKKLNSLIHPAVFRDFDQWALQQKAPYVVKEAAILFESGSYKDCDFVIAVIAPSDIRIKRVMDRDKVTETEVRKRMANQLSDEEKKERSDFIVFNDESHLLIPQVLSIHQHLLNSGKAGNDRR